jgi:nucleotide-binding universal stress UspA family protein
MTGAFAKIVCGIDGNPAALEGVRQAAALVDPGGTIVLAAVADEWPGVQVAAEPRPLFGPDAVAEALSEAHAVLADSDLRVVERPLENGAGYQWDALLDEAADADLLVLGRHHLPRATGFLIGSMTTNVLHQATLPVLAAVEPPNGLPFPGRILVASDGPGHPEEAVRVAAQIARRSGSEVILLRVSDDRGPGQPEVAAAVAELTEVTGARPVEVVVTGTPHHAIAESAAAEHASLVITGGRGLPSVETFGIGSVSERVAHEAPCSVLVVRRLSGPR